MKWFGRWMRDNREAWNGYDSLDKVAFSFLLALLVLAGVACVAILVILCIRLGIG